LEIQKLRNKINRLKEGKGLAKDGYSLLKVLSYFDISVDTLLYSKEVGDLYRKADTEETPVKILNEIRRDVRFLKNREMKTGIEYSDTNMLITCLKLNIGAFLTNDNIMPNHRPNIFWLLNQVKEFPELKGSILSKKDSPEGVLLNSLIYLNKQPQYSTFYNSAYLIYDPNMLHQVWNGSGDQSFFKFDFLLRQSFYLKFALNYAKMIISGKKIQSSSNGSKLLSQLFIIQRIFKKLIEKYSQGPLHPFQALEVPFLSTLLVINKTLRQIFKRESPIAYFRHKYSLRYELTHLDSFLDNKTNKGSELNKVPQNIPQQKKEINVDEAVSDKSSSANTAIDSDEPLSVADIFPNSTAGNDIPANLCPFPKLTDYTSEMKENKMIFTITNPNINLEHLKQSIPIIGIEDIEHNGFSLYSKDVLDLFKSFDFIINDISIPEEAFKNLLLQVKTLEKEAKNLNILNQC